MQELVMALLKAWGAEQAAGNLHMHVPTQSSHGCSVLTGIIWLRHLKTNQFMTCEKMSLCNLDQINQIGRTSTFVFVSNTSGPPKCHILYLNIWNEDTPRSVIDPSLYKSVAYLCYTTLEIIPPKFAPQPIISKGGKTKNIDKKW
eukprot:3809143-Amphidinium_carterae.1